MPDEIDDAERHLERICHEYGITVEEATLRFLAGDELPDPLERLIGSQRGGIPDLSQRHDHYLGQSYRDPHESPRL